MQNRRDEEQEGCRTRGMQQRRDSIDEGCRKGGIQEMRDAKFGYEIMKWLENSAN